MCSLAGAFEEPDGAIMLVKMLVHEYHYFLYLRTRLPALQDSKIEGDFQSRRAVNGRSHRASDNLDSVSGPPELAQVAKRYCII